MATLGEWIGGSRPRTLPSAIAPVAIGSGLAAAAGGFIPGRALLALVVALALQVGVNYANDYSDGIKGTDEVRVGPVRLVGQRLATPAQVRLAAFASFAVAMLAGLALVLITQQWWLILVGAASVAAAWFYTGGSRPYGYLGLGEVFVFVFFGLVPVLGTVYVQLLAIDLAAVVAACAVGLLICTLLVVNNLRDIPTDITAGKRTLAVLLGDARTRALYVSFVAAALLLTAWLAALTTWWVLIAIASFGLAVAPVRLVVGGARGPQLVVALKQSGMLVLVYGLLTGALLAWS
ncbi:MAG: 1,4-dihydroxy-2-naphthoate polyprenyltransferase [Candidatus Nanopelagicales bacterium]|nr:1,4-dihydroxy-2-naphthoate polyprenyltransferase [Candidatus Nanopelagicales bacterium]